MHFLLSLSNIRLTQFLIYVRLYIWPVVTGEISIFADLVQHTLKEFTLNRLFFLNIIFWRTTFVEFYDIPYHRKHFSLIPHSKQMNKQLNLNGKIFVVYRITFFRTIVWMTYYKWKRTDIFFINNTCLIFVVRKGNNLIYMSLHFQCIYWFCF